MIYHPGHFHGISHEADIHWLLSLPMAEQTIVGDGQTTRWRLKFEARRLASWGGAVGINLMRFTASIGAERTQHILNEMREQSFARQVEIDEDSHYLSITPPLEDGRLYTVKYHHVVPL